MNSMASYFTGSVLFLTATVSAATSFGYTNHLSALNWQNLNYAVYATGIYQSLVDLNNLIPFATINVINISTPYENQQ
jgi:hypothetical protein